MVIDGQQRLTTVQLLLEAFADICATRGINRYDKALLKLTRNDDPMSVDPDQQFKVWPTNADQEHFRRVMTVASPAEIYKAYGKSQGVQSVGQNIADAYLFFHDAISQFLDEDGDETQNRVEALYKAVREFFRLVVIDLGQEDDAQLIFETLNARGTPLLPSDLVKNFLLLRAQQEGEDLEELFRATWQAFEEEPEYWRQEIGRGLAKRPRIDVFLQHYLTLKTRHDVSVAHLYSEFRHFLADSQIDAKTHLEDIVRYARIFQGFDHLPGGSPEAIFFYRLQQLDVSTAYPFLLDLFARYRDQPEIVRPALADLESYLVRRMVCRLTNRNYNRLFVDILGVLDGGEQTVPQGVRAFLASSSADTNRWPNDEEFSMAWHGTPFYSALVRQRVRMILEVLEDAMHSEKSEEIAPDQKLTIEHIMPQEWRVHWPLPEDIPPELAETERSKLLHTIGNLTLVTGKLNPDLSNAAWVEKRQKLYEHSILSMNKKLHAVPEWNEATIQERSAELFELARTLWPTPSATE